MCRHPDTTHKEDYSVPIAHRLSAFVPLCGSPEGVLRRYFAAISTAMDIAIALILYSMVLSWGGAGPPQTLGHSDRQKHSVPLRYWILWIRKSYSIAHSISVFVILCYTYHLSYFPSMGNNSPYFKVFFYGLHMWCIHANTLLRGLVTPVWAAHTNVYASNYPLWHKVLRTHSLFHSTPYSVPMWFSHRGRPWPPVNHYSLLRQPVLRRCQRSTSFAQ